MLNALYICPICQTDLIENTTGFCCDNNHQFDKAKEGYVNLLPVQFKKSLQPGDDKNMVLARREFLSAGYYEFLQHNLIDLIKSISPQSLVDLGCGEGYYTNSFKNAVPDCTIYGIDISKSATRYAAKRNKDVNYCVASTANVPIKKNSIELIVNIFAPISNVECRRLLAESGKLVTVTPGPEHLFELKQFIYDSPERHIAPDKPEGFELVNQNELNNTLMIENENQLTQLLTMTPFGWKITEQKKNNAINNIPFEVSLNFVVSLYKKIKI